MTEFDLVLVTDVDGTLDYRCTGIGETVVQSAVDYVKAGGGLALATGRAIISTERIAELLHVNIPSILYGGAMIYDYERKECLWKAVMAENAIAKAKEIAARYIDVAMVVYTDSGIAILNSNNMLWEKGVPEECDKRFLDADIKGSVLKINMCGEHDRLEIIRDRYFLGDKYAFNFSSHHFSEVVCSCAGKGKAMLELSKMLNAPLERFVAMGDAQNDFEMLNLAGTAFTLENASDEIKQAADIVLPHCNRQGAAEGFRKSKHMLSTAIQKASL